MVVDKIDVWEDGRVQKRSAHLNGRTYGYLYGEPQGGRSRGTIFLIHGFPDLSMGWRYQIPMLLSLGLRVVAPDCMGYGRTDAPPYKLQDFSFKRISDDLAELAKQLGEKHIILGGHDWGGAIVYRVAIYHPHLVTSLFAVCTPYFPPNPTYKPLKVITSTLPMLEYQRQLASGAVEEAIQSPSQIKSLLNAFYGGRRPTSDGKTVATPKNAGPAFNPETGIELDSSTLQSLSRTRLLSADELDYYTAEYSRHGIHAPLNWYRTRELNWADEYESFFQNGKVRQPPVLGQHVLFILATKDTVLRPELAKGMVPTEGHGYGKQGGGGGILPRLRKREVEAGHWALWERPEEVNGHVRQWLEEVVFTSEVGAKL